LFHIHAFMFMVRILTGLSSWLGMYYDWLSPGINLFPVVALWYIPVYEFLDMARVYGSSRTAIFSKSLLVITGHLLLFATVTVISALITALRF